jgi:hypothetical protein
LVGREPDRLNLKEQLILAGKWIAMEIYDPEKMPLRRIAAVGDSPTECMRELAARGLDPGRYEYRACKRPY